jgi:hypothetical protein
MDKMRVDANHVDTYFMQFSIYISFSFGSVWFELVSNLLVSFSLVWLGYNCFLKGSLKPGTRP